MKGKTIDWANTLFKQMWRELIKWTTSQTCMLRRIIKVDPKKDLYHLALVIEILMQQVGCKLRWIIFCVTLHVFVECHALTCH